MPPTKPTNPMREKAGMFREQASELEAIADKLDEIEIGDFIVIEYGEENSMPIFMGHYEGIVSVEWGIGTFHVKLAKFAYANRHPTSGKYILRSGEQVLAKVRAVAAIGGIEDSGHLNISYPFVRGIQTMTRGLGPDSAKILQKYGISPEDYKTLYPQ